MSNLSGVWTYLWLGSPSLPTKTLGCSTFPFPMSDYPLDIYSYPHIWRKVSHISLIFIWLNRSTSKIPSLKSSRSKTELSEAQYKPIFNPLDLTHMPIPLNCWQNLMLVSVAKGFIQRLVFDVGMFYYCVSLTKLLWCIICRYCI